MVKKAVITLTSRDFFEYLRIWYTIHIQSKYFPPDESIWESPIFVHIPKTAGNSIHETAEVRSVLGHKSIRFYKRKLPAGKTLPLTFTVIRNPYSRLTSSYRYLKNGGNSLYDKIWAQNNLSAYTDINDFVSNGLRKPKIKNWIHFLPQTHFITDKKGDIAVDFIIRFENLDEDWRRLAKKINCDEKLPKSNITVRGPNEDRLTSRSKNIVYNLYENDFTLLGYDK